MSVGEKGQIFRYKRDGLRSVKKQIKEDLKEEKTNIYDWKLLK